MNRKWLNFGLKIQILTAFLSVDGGRKANSHFLQNVSKHGTASYAHLSPQIYMALVAWCGIGRQEVTPSQPVRLSQGGPYKSIVVSFTGRVRPVT